MNAPLLVREQKLLTEVLTELRKLLPFALLGFDTDNDSVPSYFLQRPIHGCRAHRHQAGTHLGRELQVAMPFHGIDQSRQQRTQPLSANRIRRFPPDRDAPHRSPAMKVGQAEEALILDLRRKRRLGVKRLRNELKRLHGVTLSPATIHMVLVRHKVNVISV